MQDLEHILTINPNGGTWNGKSIVSTVLDTIKSVVILGNATPSQDYKVTYTYDLSKLSDTDLAAFGIDRDFNTQKTTYTNRGLTCK